MFWKTPPDRATVDRLTVSRSRTHASMTASDLQGRYTGFKNTTLTLGIRNLLDTTPPVSNQGNNFQVGIDPTYGDPRGRMYYGAIRYAFR